MKHIKHLACAVALAGAALIGAASPASAAVTYMFAGDFQGSFALPNASFSVTTPGFITSDETFTAAQSHLVCGDAFVTCTGVSFLTDFPGEDVVTINFDTVSGAQAEYYGFASTAFTTAGVAQNVDSNIGVLTTAVPEPGAWVEMILGLGGLGVAFRLAKRKPAFGRAVA